MVRRVAWIVVASLLVACGSTASAPSGLGSSSADDGMRVSAPGGGAGAQAPTRPPGAPGTGSGGVGDAIGVSSRPGTSGQSTTGGGPTTIAASADRSPVAVGILYTNNDAAASAGVDNGNTFSPRAVFESFVTAYNARGGIAGRPIEPVYVELRSSSVDLPADLQAACATFTQDNDVAVVLSTTGVFSEELATCLSESGTPQIAGDYALGDADSLAAAPMLYAPATLTVDDRFGVLLDAVTDAGRVTTDDRIGVVVEGCAHNVRAYERSVEPAAARLGLTITERVDSRCFQGINDLSGLASEMGSAVLRFRTASVSTVLFISGSFEGNLMLLFGAAAESQGYRPDYALTSAVAAKIQEANTPPSQLANAVGLGWLPAIDSVPPADELPAAQRCLHDLRAASGVVPASAADRYTVFTICDTFALYDAALVLTSGASDAASVAAAIDRLDRSFAASATEGEATDFGNGRRTGPARGRLFAWSAACDCFDYTSEPFGLRVS